MFRSLVPWRMRSETPTTGRFSNMMKQVEEETEDLMERFWGGHEGWLTGRPSFSPTVDLVEAENQFEVTVDLPGLKPEEVNVELKNGDLWISGKRDEEQEGEGKTYHRLEMLYGEDHCLELVNIAAGGLEVRVLIPYREDAGSAASTEEADVPA